MPFSWFRVGFRAFSFNCRSSESYLIGPLIVLGLLELQHLIYPRFRTGFNMLGFFTNSGLIRFQVGYLTLSPHFLVIHGFESLWMGNLRKNIQLMLLFFKAPYLVILFSYYLSMAFLMIVSATLLSLQMALLYTLCVIRLMIWDNKWSYVLNLSLWTVIINFYAEKKTQTAVVLLMWQWMVCFWWKTIFQNDRIVYLF